MPPHSLPIMVAIGMGATEVTRYISIILPNVIMKMQMVSAHMVMPTNRDWNHKPKSGPSSISISRSSMPTMTLEMLMLVSPIISPEALATTLWAASNTPITIVHVFVTIRTAAADLNAHLKNIHVSMSLRLFLSVMSWISSSVITKARIAPAMGTITVSDRFCIMLKMLPFHACGDKPT